MCIDQIRDVGELTGGMKSLASRCSARDKHPGRMFENVPRDFGSFVEGIGVTPKISQQGCREILVAGAGT